MQSDSRTYTAGNCTHRGSRDGDEGDAATLSCREEIISWLHCPSGCMAVRWTTRATLAVVLHLEHDVSRSSPLGGSGWLLRNASTVYS
jgi:hypothetical protein